ncbi:unnamed protein product [Heterobilharzia americana]|nr:unnamed protein product [Heterobilharzia americana]CAH8667026.1 unnamed protein product [Heterobilharzia americana]
MLVYFGSKVLKYLGLRRHTIFWSYSRSFSEKSDVSDPSEKCVVSDFPLLAEAVNTKNYELVAKIVMEQDPFEVKRIRMFQTSSKTSPNRIPSQSSRRMVGCIS